MQRPTAEITQEYLSIVITSCKLKNVNIDCCPTLLPLLLLLYLTLDPFFFYEIERRNFIYLNKKQGDTQIS